MQRCQAQPGLSRHTASPAAPAAMGAGVTHVSWAPRCPGKCRALGTAGGTCVFPFLLESAWGIKQFSKLYEKGSPFFPVGARCELSRPNHSCSHHRQRVALAAPEFPCTRAESLYCTHGSAAIAKPPFPKQKCQKKLVLISFPSETGSAP